MRIPRPVNTAWDWAEQHARGLAVTVLVLAALGSAFLLPALAALLVGALVGGLVVYLRMSRRVTRMRAESDDLLRENGSLRHQRTVLAGGVIRAGAEDTRTLMVIPSEDEEPDGPTRRLPELPEA